MLTGAPSSPPSWLCRSSTGAWLITRPANVYGVNLSMPSAHAARCPRCAMGDGAYSRRCLPDSPRRPPAVHARHVWERSSLALRWVAQLRAGRHCRRRRTSTSRPTYAWDYAQRVCELIAQECEGIYNTAGPDSLSRRDYLLLLARAFECDPGLVRDGSTADFLAACGEDRALKLPANTTLCDEQATFVLGRPAVDPLAGHRLMREQLDRVLGCTPAIKEVCR